MQGTEGAIVHGETFRELARQKGSRVEEGHVRSDHVDVLISVPPKHAVPQVAGYINREERHAHSPELPGPSGESHGAALLGKTLLGFDSRQR